MNNKQGQRGFTLVEILVALVIATVVLAIAIPRIRAINKERNIRETARSVGSLFANASQRASIDGIAGVRIKRNPNFVDGGGFQFAATELTLLRSVPAYTGDTAAAVVSNVNNNSNTITIPVPFEQDEFQLIQRGDSISFNGSSVRYRITNINRGQLTLDRGFDNYLPLPRVNSSFVVHRLPRELRSSAINLPENYLLDLRFSGFEVVERGTFTTVFDPAQPSADIDFVFDQEGSIDRVYYRNPLTGETIEEQTPLGPAFLFITEAPNSVELTEPVATNDETSLWVTVSNSTGTVNIGYNNSGPSTGQTFVTMTNLFENDRNQFNQIIQDSRARTISTSANQ